MLAREWRRFCFGKVERRLALRLSAGRKRNMSMLFVIAIQFLEVPLPSVPFVGNQRLQQRQRGRFRSLPHILDGACISRYAAEMRMLAQISNHLAVRIRSRLLVAENLQDQAAAVKDEGISLVGRTARRKQRRLGGSSDLSVHAALNATEKALSCANLAAAL